VLGEVLGEHPPDRRIVVHHQNARCCHAGDFIQAGNKLFRRRNRRDTRAPYAALP
jgi:uncharacterized Fe-S cluster protein YjdI